ncbi:MarR family transcriptional regulator [Streptomyces sp. NPDC059740]|uniref:MarR family transcriptional regulator n=1 Tax=Streptomyces sp. NPDC059740 TaxID=3346926 RepID=UPI003660723C
MEHTDPVPSSPQPAPSPLADLYGSLSALAYAMTGTRAHSRLRTESGLAVDRASLALLRALVAACEPLRLGALAESLMVTAPHVTRQVALLEDAGLVRTARDAGDQRVRRVAATAEGVAVVTRAEEAGTRRLAEALTGFTPAELQVAADVVRRVVDAYQLR